MWGCAGDLWTQAASLGKHQTHSFHLETWDSQENGKSRALKGTSRDVLSNRTSQVNNVVKDEGISPLRTDSVAQRMCAGSEGTPLQLPFHHCRCLPLVDPDESGGMDPALEKGLGVPF